MGYPQYKHKIQFTQPTIFSHLSIGFQQGWPWQRAPTVILHRVPPKLCDSWINFYCHYEIPSPLANSKDKMHNINCIIDNFKKLYWFYHILLFNIDKMTHIGIPTNIGSMNLYTSTRKAYSYNTVSMRLNGV